MTQHYPIPILSRSDWRYLFAINGAAAAAILLLAWIAGKV